jgi:hypothetical protein
MCNRSNLARARAVCVLYIYVCATPNSRTVSEPPVETGGAHSCARTGNRRRRINLLLSHLMHAPRPAALRALGLGKCSLAANLVVPMQAISAPTERCWLLLLCCATLALATASNCISTASGQSACGSVRGASYPRLLDCRGQPFTSGVLWPVN